VFLNPTHDHPVTCIVGPLVWCVGGGPNSSKHCLQHQIYLMHVSEQAATSTQLNLCLSIGMQTSPGMPKEVATAQVAYQVTAAPPTGGPRWQQAHCCVAWPGHAVCVQYGCVAGTANKLASVCLLKRSYSLGKIWSHVSAAVLAPDGHALSCSARACLL
jgi:hypothetical protein